MSRRKSATAMPAPAGHPPGDECPPAVAQQVADLTEAVAAADRGEFASDADVRAVFARWLPAGLG